jgi:hypothetical protein
MKVPSRAVPAFSPRDGCARDEKPVRKGGDE